MVIVVAALLARRIERPAANRGMEAERDGTDLRREVAGMILEAELAMHEAKDSGGNTYVMHRQTSRAASRRSGPPEDHP